MTGHSTREMLADTTIDEEIPPCTHQISGLLKSVDQNVDPVV